MDSPLYCLGQSCQRSTSCRKISTKPPNVRRAFDKLLLMLYPKLLKNIVLSSNSTSGLGEIISPEMTMAIGLHPLVGASYIDLTSAYGISESSVFVARSLFVIAANSCEALKVVFSDSEEDFNVLQNGFQAKSTYGLISGCDGCIDGLLIEIKHPSEREYRNFPNSYYSGHYCCYGLNIQVVCDVNMCFIFSHLLPLGSHLTRLLWKRLHFIQAYLICHLVCILQEMQYTLYLIKCLCHSQDPTIRIPTKMHTS